MELEEYEAGSLSTRRFAIAAWVSIPVAALAFVMAGVSILDILSERPGPGEVPAARPRPVPQPEVTPVAAVLPGVTEGDLLLARLRAEAAAEEARVAGAARGDRAGSRPRPRRCGGAGGGPDAGARAGGGGGASPCPAGDGCDTGAAAGGAAAGRAAGGTFAGRAHSSPGRARADRGALRRAGRRPGRPATAAAAPCSRGSSSGRGRRMANAHSSDRSAARGPDAIGRRGALGGALLLGLGACAGREAAAPQGTARGTTPRDAAREAMPLDEAVLSLAGAALRDARGRRRSRRAGGAGW
jgi:hypothetical protein